MKGLWIVMPAFNEEKSIGTVIKNLKKGGYHNIFVVDDGSKDRTYAIAKKQGATVVRHPINRGLGGALGTGIQCALLMVADYIITFDADGQHG